MKVELRFFQDEANGEFGLAHKNAIDMEFNAFWTAIGIFHDVFEHSHEERHKYFMGDYAFNIAGEMAAMGSLWYYYYTLNVYKRLDFQAFYRSKQQVIIDTTKHLVFECIKDGTGYFGSELLSSIPRQKPSDDGELEYMLYDFWRDVKKCEIDSTYPEDIERGTMYKQSCTFRKIADTHRYGYKMAERLVPDNRENMDTLNNFLDYWNTFTKENEAEDMASIFEGIDFFISKKKGIVTWNARLLKIGGGYIKLNSNVHYKLSD